MLLALFPFRFDADFLVEGLAEFLLVAAGLVAGLIEGIIGRVTSPLSMLAEPSMLAEALARG